MILGHSDKVLVIIKHHSQEDCKVAAKYPWVGSLLLHGSSFCCVAETLKTDCVMTCFSVAFLSCDIICESTPGSASPLF